MSSVFQSAIGCFGTNTFRSGLTEFLLADCAIDASQVDDSLVGHCAVHPVQMRFDLPADFPRSVAVRQLIEKQAAFASFDCALHDHPIRARDDRGDHGFLPPPSELSGTDFSKNFALEGAEFIVGAFYFSVKSHYPQPLALPILRREGRVQRAAIAKF